MASGNPFTLGISGGSAAGKSTVARLLADALDEFDPAVVEVDRYFLDCSALPPNELAGIDFDSPDALDFKLLAEDLQELKSGRKIYLPDYNYATHSSKPRATPVNPSSLIIVEGILLFYPPVVQPLLDCKVFVEAGREERLRRRIARDMAERGRSRESVIRQFNETVEPGFQKYTAPTREEAEFAIDWNRWDLKAVESIAERVRALMV